MFRLNYFFIPLWILYFNFGYSQIVRTHEVISEDITSEYWTRSSLYWIPKADSLYSNGVLKKDNVLSLGESNSGSFSELKRYSIGQEELTEISVFSFSPEVDCTIEQMLRPKRDEGTIRINPLSFRTKQDLLNYHENLKSIAKDIHKLINLKYARVVSPNKEIIEALLLLPSLEHLLLINPTEKVDATIRSNIKTLEVYGENEETYFDVYSKNKSEILSVHFKYLELERSVFPVDLTKQKFPKLEQLNVSLNSGVYNDGLGINHIKKLKHLIFQVNLDFLNNEQDFVFPKTDLLEVDFYVNPNNVKNWPVYVNSNVFKKTKRLNMYMNSPVLPDKHFKTLNQLRSLQINLVSFDSESKNGEKQLVKALEFPKRIESLSLTGDFEDLDHLKELKKLEKLELRVVGSFHFDSILTLKKLKELDLYHGRFENLNRNFIPKSLALLGQTNELQFQELISSKNLKNLDINMVDLKEYSKLISQLTFLKTITIHVYPKETNSSMQYIDELKEKMPTVDVRVEIH